MESEVVHYLATGESDSLGRAFPSGNTLDRLKGYEHYLREALLKEVRHRERGYHQKLVPPDLSLETWTRRKVKPMITGLFSTTEQEVVLRVAGRSIVFLTREAAHTAIRETPFLGSAWTIANLYLNALGACALDNGFNKIVGFSLETKCYVDLDYFTQKDPFADCVTHEVAHIFHNCRRETLGLPSTRSREWLLDIAFGKRETFAYACEAYGRILEQSQGKADRKALLLQYACGSKIPDDRVDQAQLLNILAEAIEVRNGWKRILARCSAKKQKTPEPPS